MERGTMRKSRWLLFAALMASVVLGLAACGGDGGDGDTSSPGAKVFADADCGNCHTLEAAGSNGTIGPNLDEADPSFDEVVRKVKSGGGGMPSFEGQLSEQEIRDVAAFVAARAGGG